MLNRLLFLLTTTISLSLFAAVVLAPGAVEQDPAEASELLLLFAFDATIRKTAIFCALGLLVTAVVFFRNSGASDDEVGGRGKRPPSANSVGA